MTFSLASFEVMQYRADRPVNMREVWLYFLYCLGHVECYCNKERDGGELTEYWGADDTHGAPPLHYSGAKSRAPGHGRQTLAQKTDIDRAH
jgi:hypothetical protein